MYKSIHLQTPKKSTKSVRNSIQIGFLDVLFVCRNLWTVNNVRKMLRTLLNEAVRRGMLSADDNPYPKVKAPSNLPVKQQRSFTEDQRDQFLQYAGKSLYANLYKLLLYTGMRVGEALALMICDVDWDNHVLHVTKNLQKTTQGVFYIETPKTRESIRDIYLVPEAEEAIKSQLELRKIIVEPIQKDIKGEFENLLFVNTKGKPVNVGSVRQSINRIVERRYVPMETTVRTYGYML